MKALAFFIAIALVFGLVEWTSNKGTPTLGEIPVKLYYYNPVHDKGPGGINCSEAGLEEVDRKIASNDNKIADTISLLLKGELTLDEKGRGIETEFPLQGLSLKSVNLSDGILTLEFDDPFDKTSGGACRVTILKNEVIKTAMQFKEVTSVIIKPDDIFQP